ncbi:hypothetical protein DFH27DRAFT_629875 [Peziza echinospora]|nr:hypothetical protein DFH27DRAFT_629875 [Peziza echinospora]
MAHLTLPSPVTVRVSLDRLHFSIHRPLDQQLLHQLHRSFEHQGCDQENPLHAIPAAYDGSLDHLQHLETFDEELDWLHGYHRIAAAKNLLPPARRWWLINLYPNLTETQKNQLREVAVSTTLTEGQALRNLLLSGDTRWLAYFSKDKERAVKICAKRHNLWNKLKALTPYVGLWADLRLGGLLAIFVPNVEVELIRYLDGVYNFWSQFDPQHVDTNTVKYLSLKCAATNPEVDLALRSRIIFKEAPEEDHAWISHALRSVDLIPSLISFFSNLYFLAPPTKRIALLVPKVIEHFENDYWHLCWAAFSNPHMLLTEAKKFNFDIESLLDPAHHASARFLQNQFKLNKIPWEESENTNRINAIAEVVRGITVAELPKESIITFIAFFGNRPPTPPVPQTTPPAQRQTSPSAGRASTPAPQPPPDHPQTSPSAGRASTPAPQPPPDHPQTSPSAGRASTPAPQPPPDHPQTSPSAGRASTPAPQPPPDHPQTSPSAGRTPSPAAEPTPPPVERTPSAEPETSDRRVRKRSRIPEDVTDRQRKSTRIVESRDRLEFRKILQGPLDTNKGRENQKLVKAWELLCVSIWSEEEHNITIYVFNQDKKKVVENVVPCCKANSPPSSSPVYLIQAEIESRLEAIQPMIKGLLENIPIEVIQGAAATAPMNLKNFVPLGVPGYYGPRGADIM